MSCYICSDQTVSAIVHAMRQSECASSLNGLSAWRDADAVGQELVNMNYKSVSARYGEDRKPHRFTLKHIDGINEGVMLGCVENYEYQSCEAPEWDSSDIKFVLASLESDLARKMAAQLGYEVPWGL